MMSARHPHQDNHTKLWLHDQGHGHGHGTLAWTDGSGKVIDDANYPMDALPTAPAPHTPIHVLIPAQQVSFFSIDNALLPAKNPSQALAYALEEQLAQDPDQAHIVMLAQKNPNKAMAVDRQYLTNMIDMLTKKHYQVVQMVPESLALPFHSQHDTVYIDSNKAILNSPQHGIITCMPSQLTQWLPSDLTTPATHDIKVYHGQNDDLQALPDGFRHAAQQVSTHWLIEQQHMQNANFCQGIFAPSPIHTRHKKTLFWVVFALWLTSMACYALNPWWALHQQYQNQQTKFNQFIKEHHVNISPTAPLRDWQLAFKKKSITAPLLRINTINQTQKQNITSIAYHQHNHTMIITFANIPDSARSAWQNALDRQHSTWQQNHNTWQLTWDLNA
jgi:type II secretion system protein L